MSLLQFLRVFLDTAQEIVTAFRVLNVFYSDIDTLLEVAIANALVENDADRRLGNIVDNTSAASIQKRICQTKLLIRSATAIIIPPVSRNRHRTTKFTTLYKASTTMTDSHE